MSAEAFAPYGEVLDCAGEADRIINQGHGERYHDRAHLDFGTDGRAGMDPRLGNSASACGGASRPS